MPKENLSRRLHTQVSDEEGAIIEQAALDDDRSVSAFIRRAVLRDVQYQETAKRAKVQFRKTMGSQHRVRDEVAPRFKGKQ